MRTYVLPYFLGEDIRTQVHKKNCLHHGLTYWQHSTVTKSEYGIHVRLSRTWSLEQRLLLPLLRDTLHRTLSAYTQKDIKVVFHALKNTSQGHATRKHSQKPEPTSRVNRQLHDIPKPFSALEIVGLAFIAASRVFTANVHKDEIQ